MGRHYHFCFHDARQLPSLHGRLDDFYQQTLCASCAGIECRSPDASSRFHFYDADYISGPRRVAYHERATLDIRTRISTGVRRALADGVKRQ